MRSYLVEAYLPRSHAEEARAAGRRARATAEQLSREGVLVRYVRTTFLPDDETCFHLFDADCSEAVEEVCRPRRDRPRPRRSRYRGIPIQAAAGAMSTRRPPSTRQSETACSSPSSSGAIAAGT